MLASFQRNQQRQSIPGLAPLSTPTPEIPEPQDNFLSSALGSIATGFQNVNDAIIGDLQDRVAAEEQRLLRAAPTSENRRAAIRASIIRGVVNPSSTRELRPEVEGVAGTALDVAKAVPGLHAAISSSFQTPAEGTLFDAGTALTSNIGMFLLPMGAVGAASQGSRGAQALLNNPGKYSMGVAGAQGVAATGLEQPLETGLNIAAAGVGTRLGMGADEFVARSATTGGQLGRAAAAEAGIEAITGVPIAVASTADLLAKAARGEELTASERNQLFIEGAASLAAPTLGAPLSFQGGRALRNMRELEQAQQATPGIPDAPPTLTQEPQPPVPFEDYGDDPVTPDAPSAPAREPSPWDFLDPDFVPPVPRYGTEGLFDALSQEPSIGEGMRTPRTGIRPDAPVPASRVKTFPYISPPARQQTAADFFAPMAPGAEIAPRTASEGLFDALNQEPPVGEGMRAPRTGIRPEAPVPASGVVAPSFISPPPRQQTSADFFAPMAPGAEVPPRTASEGVFDYMGGEAPRPETGASPEDWGRYFSGVTLDDPPPTPPSPAAPRPPAEEAVSPPAETVAEPEAVSETEINEDNIPLDPVPEDAGDPDPEGPPPVSEATGRAEAGTDSDELFDAFLGIMGAGPSAPAQGTPGATVPDVPAGESPPPPSSATGGAPPPSAPSSSSFAETDLDAIMDQWASGSDDVKLSIDPSAALEGVDADTYNNQIEPLLETRFQEAGGDVGAFVTGVLNEFAARYPNLPKADIVRQIGPYLRKYQGEVRTRTNEGQGPVPEGTTREPSEGTRSEGGEGDAGDASSVRGTEPRAEGSPGEGARQQSGAQRQPDSRGDAGESGRGSTPRQRAGYVASPEVARRAGQKVSAETKALLMRGMDFGVPQDVVETQIHDVGLIKEALTTKKQPLFVLANEAGSGKSFILGGAIRELRNAGKEKFTFVTQNTQLIEQLKGDLSDYDLEGVDFKTYKKLQMANESEDALRDLLEEVKDTVVILDESHNAKGAQSQTGKVARAIFKVADKVIYSSATPYENPADFRYFEPTGLFAKSGGFAKWARKHGAIVQTIEDPKTGEVVEYPYWPVGDENNAKNSAKAYQWMVDQGIYSRRQTYFPEGMVENTFNTITIPDEWKERLAQIEQALAMARASLLSGEGGSKHVMALNMYATNLRKRAMESGKLAGAIPEIRRIGESGQSVAIFVEHKSARPLDKFKMSGSKNSDPYYSFEEMARMMDAYDADPSPAKEKGPAPFSRAIFEFARAANTLGIEWDLPSPSKTLRDELGADNVAMYTGDETNPQAASNKEAWAGGDRKYFIATMAKGGTGLSLHDTVGNRPTTQININLPWSAIQFDQVNRRTARYGLKSKADVVWLLAEDNDFERGVLAPRMAARASDLGAVVNGIEPQSSRELLEWDFGNIDPTSKTVEDLKSVKMMGPGRMSPQMKASQDQTRNAVLEANLSTAARQMFNETPRFEDVDGKLTMRIDRDDITLNVVLSSAMDSAMASNAAGVTVRREGDRNVTIYMRDDLSPGYFQSTAYHEFFHAMWKHVLTEDARNRMGRLFREGSPEHRRLIDRLNEMRGMPEYDSDRIDMILRVIENDPEEAAAYGFEMFANGRLTPDKFSERLYDQVRLYRERLMSWLKGQGFVTDFDMLTALKSGDYAATKEVRPFIAKQSRNPVMRRLQYLAQPVQGATFFEMVPKELERLTQNLNKIAAQTSNMEYTDTQRILARLGASAAKNLLSPAVTVGNEFARAKDALQAFNEKYAIHRNRMFKKYADLFDKANAEERETVYRILTDKEYRSNGGMWETLDSENPKHQKYVDAALEIRGEIDFLSRELLRQRVVSDPLADAIRENMYQYVTRWYKIDYDSTWVSNMMRTQPERFDDAVSRIYAEVRSANADEGQQALTRKLVEESLRTHLELRQRRVGLNRTAGGSSTKGRMDMSRLMERNPNIDKWVRELWGEVDLKRESPALLFEKTVHDIQNLIAKTEFHRDLSAARRGDGTRIVSDSLDRAAGNTEMLDDPAYGALQGRFVSPEIKSALDDDLATTVQSLLGNFYRFGTLPFHYSQTVLSYGTHARNILGNGMFAYYANASPTNPKNFRHYKAALMFLANPDSPKLKRLGMAPRDYIDNHPMAEKIEEAIRSGGYGKQFFNVPELEREIKIDRYAEDFAEEIGKMDPSRKRRMNIARIAQKLRNSGSLGLDAARSAYIGEDRVFRLAALIKRLEDNGGNVTEAVDWVQRFFVDYSRVPQAAQVFQKFPVAAPFLSFAMEMPRVHANVIAHNPIKAAQLAGFVMAGYAATEALWPGQEDSEDWKKAQNLLPGYYREGANIIIPDGDGGKAFLNLDSIFPTAGFINTAKNLRLSDYFWGNPIAESFLIATTGHDSKNAVNIPEQAGITPRLVESGKRVMQSYIPPEVPFMGRTWPRLYRAFTGETDKLGRQEPHLAFWMHAVGMRPQRMAWDVAYYYNLMGELDAINYDVNKIARAMSNNPGPEKRMELKQKLDAIRRSTITTRNDLWESYKAGMRFAPNSTNRKKEHLERSQQQYKAALSRIQRLMRQAG